MSSWDQRWAVENQTHKGEWWQNLHRYDTEEEARRNAQSLLRSNRRTYLVTRVVDTQASDYVEGAVPIDY